MLTLAFVVQCLVFVSALSLDVFAVSLAYGAEKKKIWLSQSIIINMICSCLLGVGLKIGDTAEDCIPQAYASVSGGIILLAVGAFKLFGFFAEHKMKGKCSAVERELGLLHRLFMLKGVKYSNRSEIDCKKRLSAQESILLALSLSLDGFTAGISAGLSGNGVGFMVMASFVAGMAAVVLGGLVGGRLARKTEINLSWLSGALLVFVALSKFIG